VRVDALVNPQSFFRHPIPGTNCIFFLSQVTPSAFSFPLFHTLHKISLNSHTLFSLIPLVSSSRFASGFQKISVFAQLLSFLTRYIIHQHLFHSHTHKLRASLETVPPQGASSAWFQQTQLF